MLSQVERLGGAHFDGFVGGRGDGGEGEGADDAGVGGVEGVWGGGELGGEPVGFFVACVWSEILVSMR